MILEIIIFLISTIVVYYLYTYKKIHNYFKQRDVKFLKGLPIFGNMLKSALYRMHFIDELDEVYRAYPDERYVGYIEYIKPIILIRDPELIKAITVKDFDHFTDHKEFFSEEADPLLGGSLFFMKGNRWRDMRSTLSPAFTSSKIKHVLPFMIEITNYVIEYLKEHQSEDINVIDLTRRYTNDVIASAGFGLRVNSVKDRDNEFYKIGSSMFSFTLKQRAAMMLLSQFPQFAKVRNRTVEIANELAARLMKAGLRLFSNEDNYFFTNVVASTMKYRKKEKVERPDMVQLLMETPKQWTTAEQASQVFNFFAGGFETSASVLSMSIHELALHPEIEEKLYQEVSQHKEKKDLLFENISDLKYLECVVNETLRKWSPALLMDRTCVKRYELPEAREGGQSYVVNPGDVVFNMVNCLHRDPKYFPDPETFNPDRFSEENKHNIKPFTFMPFGMGPRICIGMRFVYVEIKVLLYYLVLNFKIKKCEKTQEPIRLQPHKFNVRALGGTYVRFEKRSRKTLP